MDTSIASTADEAARLRGCLNDLVSVIALPALWAGGGPPRIVGTMLDALVRMLDPVFVLARMNDSDGGIPIEMARVAGDRVGTIHTSDVGRALEATLGDAGIDCPPGARVSIGGTQLWVASARLGLQADIGILVVGSDRPDFPGQTERLVLDVAANQAALGLQQARILSEQGRVAAELNERVAQRTSELLAANEALQREVTERRRAEEALIDSERESRQIVDSIPGLVATLTPAGEIEIVNNQVLAYCGRTLEELQQWTNSDTVHPEDLSRVIAITSESMKSGDRYEIEQRIRRFDGVYRWFQVRGLPLRDTSGNIVRWYNLLTDIDERKRAEVELRRAYDSFRDAQRLSRTGSFTADIVADEHVWSDELYRICEFDPGTKITTNRAREIIHAEDQPLFDAGFARSLEGADFDVTFRIVTRSGKMKHLHSIARVVDRVGGRPLFVGAIQDVTEAKSAEEALNRARSELAHVTRVTTLSTLTASIAHEVNQPLSGIITNAGTCLRMLDADPPNVAGARDTARRTIRDGYRASEVMTRLRALFSKREFALELLNLNDAIQEVIALSRGECQRNRIMLQVELADDLPNVTGDRVQLQQVILNLLRNASDAMVDVHDRPRQLLVKTERGDGDRVRVSVRDAGIGVDPQVLDKLFDAFYTTKSDGMGIGLSVSRSIIERHHGRLWAERNEGPGATFAFLVPSHPESVTDAAPTVKASPSDQ